MLSWVYPIRIVQAFFALVTIGLASYGATTPFNNVVYFMLFTGCWTAAIAVPYLGLAPLWLPRISHEFVIPAMELITMALWLSGWIAVAALIPHPSACNGAYCEALQAQIVIAAIEWVLFLLTNVFALLDVRNSRSNRHTNAREMEQDQPPVSQVDAAESA
ncbi:hypothetical protein N7528_005499 [Penicillium herquei]|nr:hypothetical protein N7528_005499 [Penicillium herquei]